MDFWFPGDEINGSELDYAVNVDYLAMILINLDLSSIIYQPRASPTPSPLIKSPRLFTFDEFR